MIEIEDMIQRQFFSDRQKLLKIVKNRKELFLCLLFAGIGLTTGLQLSFHGLVGRYYDNPEWKGGSFFSIREKAFNLDRCRQLIELADFPAIDFSISWQGWIRIDRKEIYHFRTYSDDGSSVIIDGKLVVNNGGLHPGQEAFGEILLEEGMHQISINYFNGPDLSEFSIAWMEPGGQYVPIPNSILFPWRLSDIQVTLSRYARIIFFIGLVGLFAVIIKIAKSVLQQSHTFSFRLSLTILGLAGIVIVGNWMILIRNISWDTPFPYNIFINAIHLHHSGIIRLDKKLSSLLVGDTQTFLGAKKYANHRELFCFWYVYFLDVSAETAKQPFYATIRRLYSQRVLFLPSDELFQVEELKKHGEFSDIRYYHQPRNIDPSVIETLDHHPLYRFIYNPYMYHLNFHESQSCPELDFSRFPIFLLLIPPENRQETQSSAIIALPIGKHLYFIPEDQLPVSLKGIYHE